MRQFDAQQLYEQYRSIHDASEVTDAAEYLRSNGEDIPNEPSSKIAAYVGFMANGNYANNGVLNGSPESLERQIESHVVKREDVQPESWIIALHGNEVNQQATDVLVASVQEVQRAGLHEWAEHLSQYSPWFRDYAFEELVRLGGFNYRKGEFETRGKGCIAPFPPLNPRAVEHVYVRVMASVGGAFGQLYSHALDEVSGLSPEERRQNEGSWIKFNQTDDWEKSWILGRFYAVCNFRWYDLSQDSRPAPLLAADYYIYCTPNEDGVHCVPRIGIGASVDGAGPEWIGGSLKEIVGDGPDMSVETEMEAVRDAKMSQLHKEDGQKLDDILRRLQVDPSVPLAEYELRLIYSPANALFSDLWGRVQNIRDARKAIGADVKWIRAHHNVDRAVSDWAVAMQPAQQVSKNHIQRILGSLVGR